MLVHDDRLVGQHRRLTRTGVAVQNLCRAIINNSDADPSNDNKSVFDTGAAGPNGFARPGNPFFPLEIELRQGNPNVQPESGDTYTIGLVTQFDNLTVSFDYYNIKITDAIAPLNSLFAYQQCFNANGASNPTLSYTGSKYCSLILRNVQSGERASVAAPFINTGSLKTDGLDVQVNWRKDLGKGLVLHQLAAHVPRQVRRAGRAGYPDRPREGHAADAGRRSVQVQGDDPVRLQLRRRQSQRRPAVAVSAGASRTSRWRVRRRRTCSRSTRTSRSACSRATRSTTKIKLRMGIDNLTDEQPNIVGARPGDNNAEVTRADYYDILGRRAYVGVKMSF